MIDVSPLTQMAQSQTVVPETVRTVEPVQAAVANSGAGGSQKQGRDAQQDGFRHLNDRGERFREMNHVMAKDSSLQFRVDQESKDLVVSLLDSDGEVIRQMPSELILRLAQRIEEIQAQGKLGLDEMA